MSTQVAVSTIKLEGEETTNENSSEIQTYLNDFNKEIDSTSNGTINTLTQIQREDDDEGTYFIDQAGRYYYQSKNGDTTMLAIQTEEEETETNDQNTNSTNEDENSGPKFIIQNDSTNSTIVQNSNQQLNQMLLSNENGEFQTVTIVPTDGNSSDVSYVLIVQQPDDIKNVQEVITPEDTNVYEFDENDESRLQNANANSDKIKEETVDDKSTIVKVPVRKTQTVAQAHMCNYCNYTSPKRYLLARHMKSHSEERPHKCSVCERGFKTLASLQNHVNTHTGTKPHKCKFCESAFTTSGEMVRHVRYKHTHEKPHKCHECDYASVELSKLKRHIRCHTGERPYQCPHCTYASPDTFKLKRHLRIHTGEKPYVCDICESRFTQSNSLKAHKLIHNVGQKPIFACELCPATCGRKTDLRIHVQKLHTSDKPLKCRRCGKSFPDRYNFKLHNKTHEGEKCFKCELCPYASISARHLESHMLIHFDQKPYHCDLCGQSFRQKQLLKRHQNLYHNPEYIPPPPKEKTHECAECGRGFRHKGNLIRHMAVHDPESSVQEKQLALKLGRQKKIQLIDGQQVEIMQGVDSEDEEDENETITQDGDTSQEMEQITETSTIDLSSQLDATTIDGQQYVVLEVIEFTDNENGTNQSSVVKRGAILPTNGGEITEEAVMAALCDTKTKIEKKIKDTSEDMKTCFGFDEDENVEADSKTEIVLKFESS